MKRHLFLLVCAAVMAVIAGCAKTEDIDNLQKQIDELKNIRIASIDEQITKINTSIDNLKAVDCM